QQAGLHDPQGGGTVLDLRLLVLHGDDGAGGQVRHAHGGVGGVDRLAAGTGGAEHVDLEVVLRDVDVVGGFDQRDHLDRREGGLAAALVVEGADPHQTVGAALDGQGAVGEGGGDLEGHRLQPRLL